MVKAAAAATAETFPQQYLKYKGKPKRKREPVGVKKDGEEKGKIRAKRKNLLKIFCFD